MKKFDIEKLTSDGKIEKVYGVPTVNGLCIKVYRSGRKKFYYRRRVGNGRSKYILVGEYPIYNIDSAREKLLKLKQNIEFGQFVSKDEDATFVDIMRKALIDYYSNSKASTQRTCNIRTNHLVNHFKNTKLLDVKPQQIKDIYNEIESSGRLATLKRINQIMGITYKYAEKHGYISKDMNPLPEVNYKDNYRHYENSKAKHHPKLTDLEDISNFLDSLCNNVKDDKLHYIIATIFTALTGMRSDSVTKLKWQYFNDDFSRMVYPKKVLKGERATEANREDLILPMPPILQNILCRYRKTTNPYAAYCRDQEYVFVGIRGRISCDGLRMFVKELSDDKITPHGLRGTLTTWSKKRLDHMVPLFFIKMFLHQKPSKDEIEAAYTEIHYTDKEVQEQLLKLGTWYSEFLRSQFDYVTPILEKLY